MRREPQGAPLRKLDRQIIDLLANREYIIERQKHLCAFFESESERMNEIADWLINRVKQKRHLQKQMSFF